MSVVYGKAFGSAQDAAALWMTLDRGQRMCVRVMAELSGCTTIYWLRRQLGHQAAAMGKWEAVEMVTGEVVS